MRIMLAANSPYYPSSGGGSKSNRLLMEALADLGHTVRVVTRSRDFGPGASLECLRAMAEAGIEGVASGPAIHARLGAIDVRILTAHSDVRTFVSGHIDKFAPDVILSSTDDPAHLMLEPALRSPSRVVYLIRATVALPFGPDSTLPSDTRTSELRQVDASVGVSEHVARYARDWGGLDTVHVPISLLPPTGSPLLGRLDNPYVTMVNPCAVKGISIFLRLADRFDGTGFAAVPGWGTTKSDLEELRQRTNVTVLQEVEDIDDILCRTKVVLVPSLWAEARSRMILEAMSRGIPVLASNVGGLAEAMLGLDYLLPVRPVTGFDRAVDGLMVPVAKAVPDQDLEPWAAALSRLLSDRRHYEGLSTTSRTAALEYAGGLSARPFAELLERAVRTPKKAPLVPALSNQAPPRSSALSPEKQKLLAARIHQKLASEQPRRRQSEPDSWLPVHLRERASGGDARAELAAYGTASARAELGPDAEILWDGMWVLRAGPHYIPVPTIFEDPRRPDWKRLAGRPAKYIRDAADYWFHVYRPRPGDTIADIGAGRGEDVYAFSAAVGPAGRVVAIEPHPYSFSVLTAMCRLNRLDNVTALQYACVDAAQTLQIESPPVWESSFVRVGEQEGSSVSVPGRPFDEICREIGIERLDFLKMNIEGAEVSALPGCRGMLEHTRRVCVAAHDFRADRGDGEHFRTASTVRDFLTSIGFTVAARDQDPRYYVRYHIHGHRAL